MMSGARGDGGRRDRNHRVRNRKLTGIKIDLDREAERPHMKFGGGGRVGPGEGDEAL